MGEVFFCRKKQPFFPLTSTAFVLENDYNVPQMKTQEVEKSQGKMVYRVYIDVIFAVNLFMDLAVLCHVKPTFFLYRADLKHMIRGAVLGAVWACVLAVFQRLLCFADVWNLRGSWKPYGSNCLWDPKQERADPGSRRIYLISVVLGGVMLALSESSLGREVANWMPGRFSIRFFLAAGAFCFCFWVGDL